MPCSDKQPSHTDLTVSRILYEERKTELFKLGDWAYRKYRLKSNFDLDIKSNYDNDNMARTLCAMLRSGGDELLLRVVNANYKDPQAGALLSWWAEHCRGDEERQNDNT